MSHRVAQLNELLRGELAKLADELVVIPNGLITITFVQCSPDLRYARIGVSVLPEQYFGSALTELQKHNSQFAQRLKKNTRLRHIPKFDWQPDDTEAKAAEIEALLNSIRQ
ncbi:MAG: ribosome-binding factor A [Candidatus Falkowbacteria bacterium]